ncbi:uncharacterized protein GGS22DRAFT_40400 [Annulohypoxylon maeteangense]|uniref:uncharacterized protein n=1 Tax=Annulohypoxylon maeteangense TaxID=1927788 RepID=UPI0020087035|nr:uncharacterized protein GGS22DRAFT_40400 [Annulohypoxylon maeteangense]KAI0882766.1 hypothetical protein GGS22DRAFT_40400 [Annulohypoxylon maeteangense]
MGRRPNQVIVQFFERGPKLNDNSNRYHHRCKACGEDFPKGRSDSLTAHLLKKCPAISQADRVNVCLTLNGLNNANPTSTANRTNATNATNRTNRSQFDTGNILHNDSNHIPNHNPIIPSIPIAPASPIVAIAPTASAPVLEQSQNQIWTPLETLAEVSRQIEANEKHDDHSETTHDATNTVPTTLPTSVPGAVPIAATDSNSFEFHEQFTLDNPPTGLDNNTQIDNRDVGISGKMIGPAERRLREVFLHEYRDYHERHNGSQSALSVAAAATAHLNNTPIIHHQADHQMDAHILAERAAQEQEHHEQSDMLINYPPSPERQHASQSYAASSTTPWDGMTYISDDIHAPATVNDHGHAMAATLSKGGRRMNTSNNHGKHHHSRARFDDMRRKQVQEVRRIGACARCKILRKTCSPGTPCDACKKVSTPRVWRTECIRAQLCEDIDLYSAGVQAVMSQKRINGYKSTHDLENSGLVVEVSHFPTTGHKATFQVLKGVLKGDVIAPDPAVRILLLDNNAEDIPGKVEAYMRDALPQLIRQEPSHHIRVTLDTAVAVAAQTGDELLKKALELWGIVQLMDLERQWTMRAKSPNDDIDEYWIDDAFDSEAYTNICLQLTAAAERKASIASKNLLSEMRRRLQDGKIKHGFPMFLVVILFLNCIEKTTWAFKVWEEENLRPKWPLERPPSNFTRQGDTLADLLRVLLKVRNFLPKLVAEGPDSPITALKDSRVIEYFQHLGITQSYLQSRQDPQNFQPEDSRSLEFLYGSKILLPEEQ